ncbi:hypothetical protein BH10ACT3_BH10ACT3_16450 [soil metagenome]
MSLSVNPVNPDDLIQLSVVLPARLALTAQEMVLRLLAAEGETTAPWSPNPDMHSDVVDAWDMPAWTDNDEDRRRMAWLVADLDPKHIDVLSRIHNEPQTPTNDLLASAGYPSGTKASGVFRAITNRFRKVNRRPLWHGGEQTPEGQALRSPGELGEVVGVRLFAESVAELSEAAGTGNEGVDWDAVIAQVELTESNVALIHAFRNIAGRKATAGMLATELNYDGFGAANLAIGALGKRLAAARSMVDPDYEPSKRSDGSAMWWNVVATGEISDADGLFWWTLRDDLDEALSRVGI